MTGTYKPRPGKRTTLRDVALEAGVSIKTASRVVNGEPTVNAVMADRVEDAVERLGYRPNELARGLKGRRSRTIGLIIADVSNPFMAICAQAIEGVARERGHALILCDSRADLRAEDVYVGLLTQRQVDGLLLVPAQGRNTCLNAEQRAGLPVVAFDRPAEGVQTDSVLVENRAGAREATEHLIDHGHERVAFVGDVRHFYTARKRLEGYKEALEAANLEPLHSLDAHSIELAEEATKGFLDAPDPPTALFAANILTTLGALRAIEDLGLRIPEDIAVIGFDDFELAHVLRPRFTLVHQPAAELGRRAAEMLFDRLEGRGRPEPQRLVLPTELIVRESCGCPAEPSP
ncbi:MAG: Transcriptional regulator, LacI family [uncultured Rubrobacteraceae bacterium]|uniref:Transcriptional regulator, LacI family n=1 Tax=uncultured Rubrobacteraceae bacterium TaxID=349277 RepID=A0A6J4Q690_9ACTN|nr:MAG: Transcriptional regulator, LacI family [uncultured Rubrobacteraceae bacterium]